MKLLKKLFPFLLPLTLGAALACGGTESDLAEAEAPIKSGPTLGVPVPAAGGYCCEWDNGVKCSANPCSQCGCMGDKGAASVQGAREAANRLGN